MDTLVFLAMATACIVTYTCLEPHKRGFWTHDQSIQYPFRPLTVSLGSILSISFVAPFLVISLTEKFVNQRAPLLALKKYAFTIVSNIMVNLYVKFAVGRLRPHFLDVCRPSAEVMARNQFVTHFTCHPDVHPRSVSQARQSFYSGHASFAMCAAIYLILYTHDKWSRCLRTSFLQLVMFMIGVYPGLTQVNNYWHHWDDVLFWILCWDSLCSTGLRLCLIEVKNLPFSLDKTKTTVCSSPGIDYWITKSLFIILSKSRKRSLSLQLFQVTYIPSDPFSTDERQLNCL